MKAILEKDVKSERNARRRPGESDIKYFSLNSRTVIIRLFGIPIYKKCESFRD